MRRAWIAIGSLGLCVIASGCVVRSIYPWLGEETRVSDSRLAGPWHDRDKGDTAIFTAKSDGTYKVLLVNEKDERSSFLASLHQLGQDLFLVVGPEERNDLSFAVTLPGHLLLLARCETNRLSLFELDLDTFGTRADAARLQRLAEGDPDDGYVIFSPTADLEAFVRQQISDPSFFESEPLYAFRRAAE